MKAVGIVLVLLLFLVLSLPVFARGGGRRSSLHHSHNSHASKKSHSSGSKDGPTRAGKVRLTRTGTTK